MPPKNAPKNAAQKDKFKFTRQMDELILDSLLYQASIGQRNGGTFSSSAYTYVVDELRSKFPETTWNKEKFKYRLKYIKAPFTECYDAFRNISKSGWGFNPVTEMFELEDEVWDEIIKVNPDVAKWKDKQVPLYHKFEELYGKDRATGDNAVTAAEIRARRKSVTPKQGSLINDIDLMVSQNEAELEGFDEFETSETFAPIPDTDFVVSATETNASQQSGINGKGSKRKRKIDAIVEACNEMLTTNVDKLLLAQKLADPKDVLKCLKDIDFDQRYKSNAYIHLCRNRVDYDILTALPLDGRGPVLWNMMVQAQVISVTEPSPYNSSFI